jgi:cellulose synthase/poly-beta-1,6-N-acetylglucosamine synthase-like glycosyltransferase
VTSVILEICFWSGVIVTAYVYAGFPLLLSIAARLSRHRLAGASSVTPVRLTVIVPAYNEEANIENKICNLLAADYPRHQLEIIVVSDASTDGTNDVARRFEPDGVKLIVQPTRRGKTAGLNRAMQVATGDIVVFTDANAEYPAGTLGAMARYFRDPGVGLVSGYTRYALGEDGTIAEVTNLYTTLERVIKRGESAWGRCVGADGAIFAMRRSLYRTLREDDINDFVLPLSVITQGFACLFAEDAFCAEHPGKNLESEFRRQSRITNRTLRGLWRNAHLLNPLRFPLFSFFLVSHKVARFLVPVLLIGSAVALVLLAPGSRFYTALAVAAALVAGPGLLAKARPAVASRLGGRAFFMLGAFITINVAVLHGWWKFLSGQGDVTWRHDRSPVQ